MHGEQAAGVALLRVMLIGMVEMKEQPGITPPYSVAPRSKSHQVFPVRSPLVAPRDSS